MKRKRKKERREMKRRRRRSKSKPFGCVRLTEPEVDVWCFCCSFVCLSEKKSEREKEKVLVIGSLCRLGCDGNDKQKESPKVDKNCFETKKDAQKVFLSHFLCSLSIGKQTGSEWKMNIKLK